MTRPVIVAKGLTKRYGDVPAVDDLSLEISAGEVYALLGLNGKPAPAPGLYFPEKLIDPDYAIQRLKEIGTIFSVA